MTAGQPRAQTLKQAKKAYKRAPTTPTISGAERKRLEREIILDQRAERIKEAEERKRQTLKRKAKKEEQDREARKRAGVGLATQLAGYSHTQKRMKRGMENFLKAGKLEKDKQEDVGKVVEEDEEYGGWDADFIDDDTLVEEELGVKVKSPENKPQDVIRSSQSFGENIDDESFVEAEESVIQDSHQGSTNTLSEDLVRRTSLVESQSTTNAPRRDSTFAVRNVTPAKRKSPSNKELSSLPASPTKPQPPELDAWADFIASNTQIATELTPPKIVSSKSLMYPESFSISTQDLHFSDDDLDDVGNDATRAGSNAIAKSATIVPPRHSPRRGSPAFKRPFLPASASKQPHQIGSKASMLPPPRPQRLINAPCQDPSVSASDSSFGAFGLSTQVVHDLLDDDLELTDEDEKEACEPEDLQQLVDVDDRLSSSDTFGSDADFG
ncbi:hypothetical protein NA57DRAFT_59398 [Rhizodiscina lignyota]|uniref:Uncharacterized protein n=1 Tax=Rhizodiscina lignyota TaxID=1504668 RepID=A0A9P4M273_9PEZI|nr:hypothetical protein NA57DRAFT_59398 [Rhizodiscina lignyota]